MAVPMSTEPTYQYASSAQLAEQASFPNPCDYTVGNFRKTFRTPFLEYAHRIGHNFTVIRELTDKEKDLEDNSDLMYLIRFEDGSEIVAWGEEVCELATPAGATRP